MPEITCGTAALDTTRPSRRNVRDYAGAVGRASLEQLAELGSGYLAQPKRDGAYCVVSLDARGRIGNVVSRTGRPYPRSLWAGITDAIGEPYSVLVGEGEWHTEAGNRAADAQGYRNIHLFDCLRAGREYLARAPYSERRDRLCRMHYALEESAPRTPAWEGRIRDARGRYQGCPPRGPGRTPIVPQVALSRAEELWADVDRGELEGLVVVAQAAPIGARRAKLKVKPVDTLDCTVLQVSDRGVTLHWPGAGITFACGRGSRSVPLARGQVVEVAHESFYASGLPRFPRLVRARPDLA